MKGVSDIAITWGSWTYNGGNGMRVGIDVTNTTPSTSSTTCVFTVRYYTENQYNYQNNQTLNRTGNITGSLNFTNSSSTGSGAVLRDTQTHTFTYSTWGSSPGTRTFGASISGAYNGVTPSVSTTVTIPARPYAAPNTPGTPTCTRNSDSQATVNWTLSTTSQRPVTSVTVEMQTYTGSTWSGWTSAGTASGAATSFVKTGLSSNRIYRFRARANNSVGSSAYSATSNYAYMTPAAPSSAAVALISNGTQAEVSWVDPSYISAGTTHVIERSVDSGESWTEVATGLAQGSSPWVDTSPPPGDVQYRVSTVNSGLQSSWATTNSISTIVPPLAPTNLAPKDKVLDADDPITFTWQHNHGGDGATQSAVLLETSIDGGTNWTPQLSGAYTQQSWAMPGGTLANGSTVLWRIQTQGVDSVGFGPYSATASFVTSTPPVVAVTAPSGTILTSPALIEWTYSQDEGSAQTQYEVQITDSLGAVLSTHSGTGADLAWQSTYPLVDQGQYIARVRARSAAGLWSAWSESAFDVSFLPPANVDLDGEYDECAGQVALLLVGEDHVEGVTAPIESVDVYRRIDGGEWVLIVEGLQLVPGTPLGIMDPLPITNGTNEYGLVVHSSNSSTALSVEASIAAQDGVDPASGHWVFFSYGADFTTTLRFQGDPNVSSSTGRERGAEHFAGRARPVLLLGEHVDRSLSVSGTIHSPVARCIEDGLCYGDSDYRAWETMSQEATVVCYRDWKGRRHFGRLHNLKLSYGDEPTFAISTGLEEVEYTERSGAVVLEQPAPQQAQPTAATRHHVSSLPEPDHTSTRQQRLDYLTSEGVTGVGALGDEELLDLIRDLVDAP